MWRYKQEIWLVIHVLGWNHTKALHYYSIHFNHLFSIKKYNALCIMFLFCSWFLNFYKEINIQKNTRDFLQVYTVRVWMWKMCIFFVWVSKLHLSFDLLLHIWIMLVHNTEVRLYLSKPLSLLSHWYLFAHNWNTNKRELYLSDTSFFIQLWKETLELTFFSVL